MSEAVGGAPRAAKLDPGALWVAPPLIVLALLFLYPLVLIAHAALVDDAGALNLQAALATLQSRAVPGAALFNTAEIAIASTAGCLALGLALALILAFAPFPGAGLVARLIDTFIALPTFLVTLAFTFLYGSAGMLNGALDVEPSASSARRSISSIPPGASSSPRSRSIRPSCCGPCSPPSRWSIAARSKSPACSARGRCASCARSSCPPRCRRSIAGGSLCLLLTVNEFGIVLFIGAKGVITLPLLIYDKAIQESDYQAACAIAMVNVALSLGLFSLYRIAARRLGG